MSCKVSNLNVCYLVDETKEPIKLNFDVDVSNDVLTYNIYRFTELEYTQEVTDEIQIPQLKECVYFHELIWLRDNTTRVVFQGNLEIRKKGSDKCNCQNSEENNVVINVEEYTINVSFNNGSSSSYQLPYGSFLNAQNLALIDNSIWQYLLIEDDLRKIIIHIGNGVFIDTIGAVIEL